MERSIAFVRRNPRINPFDRYIPLGDLPLIDVSILRKNKDKRKIKRKVKRTIIPKVKKST